MYWFLIDCICAIVVSGAVVVLVQWLNVKDGYHILFAAVGSLTFFFGKYLSGSGMFARYHYVNTPTPEIVWKLAGIICWIAAAISVFLNLP
jgi:hypothetical protein